MIKSNRRGHFAISLDIINDPQMAEPLAELMYHCIVIDAHPNILRHQVEYRAISDKFEDNDPGAMIPHYVWQITAHRDDPEDPSFVTHYTVDARRTKNPEEFWHGHFDLDREPR